MAGSVEPRLKVTRQQILAFRRRVGALDERMPMGSKPLLLPRSEQRQRLWTPRVWPGALPVEGEIRGTWRRAQHIVRIDAWSRLSRGLRDAIEAEASALPLPGVERRIDVVWNS
jgi:hypothetical protein